MQPRRWTLHPLRLPLAVALLAIAIMALATCAGEDEAVVDCGEDVSFESTDGITLCGRHYGNGEVTVVLAHMRPSDQESWTPLAETLADEGYSAFTFNFRGYAPSGGAKEIGLIDFDLGGALDYLATLGVQRPVLVGASMGGTAAVKAAANRDVAAVIALSAPKEIDGLSAVESIDRATAPMLVIVAEDDTSARLDGAAIYDAANEPKLFEVYTGGEHGTELVFGRHRELVQARILEFLEIYAQ